MTDQPLCKRMKPEEPDESRMKLNDLPELPFELIVSYLSLEDRIKARAVSRRWYNVINSFKVKTLCISNHPSGFILDKSRWVGDAFACNFISSLSLDLLFHTLGQSIFSNLKHLRLCKLDIQLNAEKTTAFACLLSSFDRLEALDLIRLNYLYCSFLRNDFKLSLPMLQSIQLNCVTGMPKLTLDAPKLQTVKHSNGPNFEGPRLYLVHPASVEWLSIDRVFRSEEISKFTGLKYLFIKQTTRNDTTLLSAMKQLKEVHLNHSLSVSGVFEQKRLLDRPDLKIFFRGLLLTGPDDPAIYTLNGSQEMLTAEHFAYLAQRSSRLANEIPFCRQSVYPEETVAPQLAINLLTRLTDLVLIYIDRPVQDIDRFLNLLKSSDHLVQLFFAGDQSPDLFDQLPDHCDVQRITLVDCAVPDLSFLFRLNHLIHLHLARSIDAETIRKAVLALPFLSHFTFEYLNRSVKIQIDHPNRLSVSINSSKGTIVWDVDSAIQFIVGNPSEPKTAYQRPT